MANKKLGKLNTEIESVTISASNLFHTFVVKILKTQACYNHEYVTHKPESLLELTEKLKAYWHPTKIKRLSEFIAENIGNLCYDAEQKGEATIIFNK